MAFTDVYPNYVGAMLDRAAGVSTKPVPSLLPIVDWIPMYVLIVGIIGWAIDAVPDSVAMTMIAAGAIGSAVVRRFAPATDSEA